MKVITIGRNKENNDIVVNDNKVSRNHLQIIRDDQGKFSVLDLNSTNGTYVNGQRISGEVSLKVTDTLKIGDSVLPWQSYFDSLNDVVKSGPVQPRTPMPHIPVSPQYPRSNSTPKRWLRFVMMGVVVLSLAAGGAIGWKIYSDKKQKEALAKQQQEEAKVKEVEKAAEDKANREDTESTLRAAEADAKDGWDKYYKADAEAKKWEEKARNSQSEKDKEIAQLKRDNADALRKAAEKAQKDLEELNEQHKKDLQKKDEEISKAKTDQKNTKRELELTNQMQDVLNGWDDSQAAAFCDIQSPKWVYASKKGAKNVIAKRFRYLDCDKKEQKIKEMKKFKYKEKEEKKEGPKQEVAAPEIEPQPVSSSAQPDTDKTK